MRYAPARPAPRPGCVTARRAAASSRRGTRARFGCSDRARAHARIRARRATSGPCSRMRHRARRACPPQAHGTDTVATRARSSASPRPSGHRARGARPHAAARTPSARPAFGAACHSTGPRRGGDRVGRSRLVAGARRGRGRARLGARSRLCDRATRPNVREMARHLVDSEGLGHSRARAWIAEGAVARHLFVVRRIAWLPALLEVMERWYPAEGPVVVGLRRLPVDRLGSRRPEQLDPSADDREERVECAIMNLPEQQCSGLARPLGRHVLVHLHKWRPGDLAVRRVLCLHLCLPSAATARGRDPSRAVGSRRPVGCSWRCGAPTPWRR